MIEKEEIEKLNKHILRLESLLEGFKLMYEWQRDIAKDTRRLADAYRNMLEEVEKYE